MKQKYKEEFTSLLMPLCIQLQVRLEKKKETRTVGKSESRTIGDGWREWPLFLVERGEGGEESQKLPVKI